MGNTASNNKQNYSIKKNDYISMSNEKYKKSGRFVFRKSKSLKNGGMNGGNSSTTRKTYKHKRKKYKNK